MMRFFAMAVVLYGIITSLAIAQERDSYGGWKDVSLSASGAFRIEQVGERFVLVTPDGHPFVALGVNHLSAIRSHGRDEPDLFATRFGSEWEAYAADVLNNFDRWGMNTVDDSVEQLRQSTPYFAAYNFVRTAKYYGNPGQPNPYEFPDVVAHD